MSNGRKTVKILLVGDSNVGKTSIVARYLESVFYIGHIPTIGMDFKIKDVQKDGQVIRQQLWDTAGLEQYNTVTASYYRGSSAVLLVYDVCCHKSFTNVTNWIQKINERCSDNIVKFLVGNKVDSHACYRSVQHAVGQALADEWGFSFMEVSAKTGFNIEQCFNQMTDMVLTKVTTGGFDSNCSTVLDIIELKDTSKKKKDKKVFKCCTIS